MAFIVDNADDFDNLEFDLKTVEMDPVIKITNYFDKVRNEIEDHYDSYLFNGDRDGNIRVQKLDSTDRIEINYKKDKMIQLLNSAEKHCLSSRSEKQFTRLTNQLRDLQDKLIKVSHQFFYDDQNYLNQGQLLNSNNKQKNKCIEIEERVKRELLDIEKQLFCNKISFFVRNTKDTYVPKQIFGYMISIDCYLNEDELETLK